MTLEQKLVGAFTSCDTDGSKTLGKRQLYKALERAGVTSFSGEEGFRLFDEVDTDADGQLTFDEFAHLARRLKSLIEPNLGEAKPPKGGSVGHCGTLSNKVRQQLRCAFAAFDADGTGWITISELSGALRRCGLYVADGQLRKHFDVADEDRSGGIDLQEFENLVERLMRPSSLLPLDWRGPPPAASSATATVFTAFAKPSALVMAGAELSQAVRLLGVDADEPQIENAISDATKASRGLINKHAFAQLVQRLLQRDFSTDAMSAAFTPAATAPAGMPTRVSATQTNGLPKEMKLAGKAQLPPLELKVQELTLLPWVNTHPAVQAVCVLLRAAVKHNPVFKSDRDAIEAKAKTLVPVVLRSEMRRKTGAPLTFDLEANLPVGTAFVYFEVLHEPVAGFTAALASGEVDLALLNETALGSLRYDLPMYDSRSVQAGTLSIHAKRQYHLEDPATPAHLPPQSNSASALDHANAQGAAVATLEAEVARLRGVAQDLQKERDTFSVAYKTERRMRGAAMSCGAAAAPPAFGRQAEAAAVVADWRSASSASLEKTLETMKVRKERGGTAANELVGILRRATVSLMSLAGQ